MVIIQFLVLKAIKPLYISIIQIYLSGRCFNTGTKVTAVYLPLFRFLYFEKSSFDNDDVCAGSDEDSEWTLAEAAVDKTV